MTQLHLGLNLLPQAYAQAGILGADETSGAVVEAD